MATRRVALLAALLVAGVAAGSALGFSRNVKAHTGASWAAAARDGKVHVVKFYAPWCGHCKKLAPAWDELGDAFSTDARVSVDKMDCTVNKDACAAAEIRGYPTIKAYYNGAELSTHQGARELPALRGYVISAVKQVALRVALVAGAVVVSLYAVGVIAGSLSQKENAAKPRSLSPCAAPAAAPPPPSSAAAKDNAAKPASASAPAAATPEENAVKLDAFRKALGAAVPGKDIFSTDPAQRAQFATAAIAALDAAIEGGLHPNALCYVGPYVGFESESVVPFYMDARSLAVLAMDDARPLRHLLANCGADPNVRYNTYACPHLLSVTPLHALLKHVQQADIWEFNVDFGTIARALIAAGADVNAPARIAAMCVSPPETAPYKGPPLDVTAAMMVASSGNSTGRQALALLTCLLAAEGADLSVKNGEGKSVRELARLTPEAKALLDKY